MTTTMLIYRDFTGININENDGEDNNNSKSVHGFTNGFTQYSILSPPHHITSTSLSLQNRRRICDNADR